MKIKITNELFLTPLAKEHASELYKVIMANADHLKQWLAWIDKKAKFENTMAFIRHAEEGQNAGKNRHFAIEYKNKICGLVSLDAIDNRNNQARIGYWLIAELTGRGIMTRSVNALCQFAFIKLQLHKLEIRCAEKNIPSRKIPERLGFKKDGVLRDNEWLYDHYVTHVVYSILDEEFILP